MRAMLMHTAHDFSPVHDVIITSLYLSKALWDASNNGFKNHHSWHSTGN